MNGRSQKRSGAWLLESSRKTPPGPPTLSGGSNRFLHTAKRGFPPLPSSSAAMKLSELGEEAFLEELVTRFPPPGGAFSGIGDDAAAVEVPTEEKALLTVDALVEGVHFVRRTLPPRLLGRKAVAVSASDIAAMGGRALAVLSSLVVTGELEVESLWEILDGVAERAGELGMSLVGGNVARSRGPLVVDVTVLGCTHSGRALSRSGARPGDGLYVSGKIGAAVAGRELLDQGVALSPSGGLIVPEPLRDAPLSLAEACIRAHMDPAPRLDLARELNRARLATACIDVSDGLSLDLHRLCRASGVGARIEEGALPLSPGLLAWARYWKRDATHLALSGGEDYELLFTAGADDGIEALRETSDTALTRIGEVHKDPSVQILKRSGSLEALPALGWDHFRGDTL